MIFEEARENKTNKKAGHFIKYPAFFKSTECAEIILQLLQNPLHNQRLYAY